MKSDSFLSHLNRRWASAFVLVAAASGALACSTHHWAQVEASQLPPPPGDRVLHTNRVVVHLTDKATETQCVAYESYHPVCFYNIRRALEAGLTRGLWPSFPDVVIGKPKDAGPSDYLLQVEITLDALPPDDAGPGWSAGARSRYRLLREGKTIAEETLSSRSRAQFPYGTPLGEGATEVVDATILHVAQAISSIPESRPDEPRPLPRVAARRVDIPKSKPATPVEETKPSPETPKNAQAKTAPAKTAPAKTTVPRANNDDAPPPPPPETE